MKLFTVVGSYFFLQIVTLCVNVDGCSVPKLFTFLTEAHGLRYDPSTMSVNTNGVDEDQALSGSNVKVACLRKYKNIGGPYTIVCGDDGNWTPFPNCIPTWTTTPAPLQCPYTEEMTNFENGYLSNTDGFLIHNGKFATGSVTVSCNEGYTMDPISNGVYKCVGDKWSSRPYCILDPTNNNE